MTENIDYQAEWIRIDGQMLKLANFFESVIDFRMSPRRSKIRCNRYFPFVRGHEKQNSRFWASAMILPLGNPQRKCF